MKNFLAVCLLLTALYSCKEKQSSVDELIARKWTTVSIINSTGDVVRQVDTLDFILFNSSPEKTFSYELNKEGIFSSGHWKINGSALSLTYKPTDSKILIDSSQLSIVDGQAEIQLFSQGNRIAEINSGNINSREITRHFKLLTCNESTLVFEENGITFSYKYSKPAYTSGMTVNGFGRGILGIFSLVLLGFLFSRNRKGISWKLVITGLSLQILFALSILKVPFVQSLFEVASNFFLVVLSFTSEGSRFLFGDLVNPGGSIGFIFAFQILPTILFFSALTSVLFYLGILQKVVFAFAWIMSKTMKLSGSESLSAAGNIFLGQTESPLLIKPYIEKMNRSEILCLMVGGMATIAGGVLAAYIGFLGGEDPVRRMFFAKHLLAASVMSAPAAIVAAKLLMPQVEPIEERIQVSRERIGKNLLEAISNGTIDGLKLAVNVGAMLLVFIALLAMVNYGLKDLIGEISGLNDRIIAFSGGMYSGLTLQFLLGYACAPLAWLMGVGIEDAVLVGQLLGEKTILNEFVAYTTLGNPDFAARFTHEKSVIIATYVLCGFANFASIGIQIGGIGALAPGKRSQLAELGMLALIGGTLASLFTAVIVGMLI
jgi:concentrative nucleoside transporter, CNT family